MSWRVKIKPSAIDSNGQLVPKKQHDRHSAVRHGNTHKSLARDALIDEEGPWEKKIRKACIELGKRLPERLAPITLLFAPWTLDTEFQETVRMFVRRIESKVLSRCAVKVGAKLHRLFVREYGEQRGLHYHGAIEIPHNMSPEDFAALLQTTWSRMRCGLRIHVGHEAAYRWVAYINKPKATGALIDHWDLENTHLTPLSAS